MAHDSTSLGDNMTATSNFQRDKPDASFMHGHGVAQVHGPDGELKTSVPFANLITQVGEQMYGERGAGVGSAPNAPASMQLGKGGGAGGTAPSKTGAGASLGTLVVASSKAIASPASSIPSSVRRITYTATWAAGEATDNDINEVVLTNQDPAVTTEAPAANTISRALLDPPVFKGASDSLTITWNHDIGTPST